MNYFVGFSFVLLAVAMITFGAVALRVVYTFEAKLFAVLIGLAGLVSAGIGIELISPMVFSTFF